MGLPRTELGRTGLEITRVGFGAWAIAGFRRPDQVDGVVEAASLELSDEDVAEIAGRTGG